MVDGRERPVPRRRLTVGSKSGREAEGLRGDQAIARNTFTKRVKASGLGPVYKRTKTGPVFLNLNLTGTCDSDDVIVLEDRMRGGGKAAADSSLILAGPKPRKVSRIASNPGVVPDVDTRAVR